MRVAAWLLRTAVYAVALLLGAERGVHQFLTDLYPAPRIP